MLLSFYKISNKNATVSNFNIYSCFNYYFTNLNTVKSKQIKPSISYKQRENTNVLKKAQSLLCSASFITF